MNAPADKLLQNEYRNHVNQTIDYIHSHYNEDLRLDKLAQVACISKFHFHRLFRTMAGETLKHFIQRVRLEKSVPMLTRHPSKSITEIAFDCGFCCSQNYSKAFKMHYGVTPSFVRNEFNWDELKIKLKDLEIINTGNPNSSEVFFNHIFQNKHRLPIDKIIGKQRVPKIKIMKMTDTQVAYIRSKGPFRLDAAESAFQHLRQWAESRELINKDTIFLNVLWNSPSITPTDKLIHDACITVPPSVKTDKWMNIQTVPGGKFAVNHCKVETDRIWHAWMRFILHLMRSCDYRPAHLPYYQIWHLNPKQQSLKYRTMDICIPIKSLYE